MAKVALETITLLFLPALTPMPTTQPSSSGASSEVALGGLSDFGSFLEEIPKDVTFHNWRVIRKFFERTLLLIELEKVNAMCFLDLRKHSVTIMHQAFSRLVLIFLNTLPFLMPSFVAVDAFYDCFDELVVRGREGP